MGLKHTKIYLLSQVKLLELKNKRLESKARALEDKLEREKKILHELKNRSYVVSIENYTGYFKYKYNLLKSTDVWTTTERIFTYSRRSLLAARILRYTALSVALIETSAVFLLFTSALAIMIPVILLCTILVFISVMIVGKNQNNRLIPIISDKKIIFIFNSEGYTKRKDGYLAGTVKELAGDGRYFIFLISSSIKHGIFLTARSVCENAMILRETYYFKLMREIRKSNIDDKQIILVH